MAVETNRFDHTSKNFMYRDQIITKDDLQEFRLELLKDLKQQLSPHIPKPKQWLKSPEVRRLLQISPGTLQNLRVNGTLRFTKIGGIIYYSYEDIEVLLEHGLKKDRSHHKAASLNPSLPFVKSTDL